MGSKGASGGILVAWDELCWISVEEWIGNHSLSVVLQRVEDASKVFFTGVYGPSLRVEKRRFWEELNVVRDLWVFPWCIGGDFNEIRFVGERSGCRRTTRNMVAFDDFIANHELVDLPLAGARFTWNRGENPKLESWGPPPFRLEIAWLQAPRMEERLGEWWSFLKSEGPLDVVIGRKLRFVKKKLREWVKEKRAFDKNRLRWLESRIGEINFLEGEGNGNSNFREELGRIKAEHNGILLHEKISWRQKSRVKWLKEGDKNTTYFHAMASVRRRGSRIEFLEAEGEKIIDKDEITGVILEFYKKLYSSDGS
ncbi:uncharacterized protein LOC143891391 [Tasmannia lanceolata]|uniref:uncharacterized protein LOC143891391 n=1 Tax=Tasmannia lanceolata TaxID=3420 RepID=UPI004064A585